MMSYLRYSYRGIRYRTARELEQIMTLQALDSIERKERGRVGGDSPDREDILLGKFGRNPQESADKGRR